MPAQSFEASVLVASQQAADIFLLTVYLPPQYDKPKAGQFYMLRAWAADEPPLLSRPISVHHYEEGTRALSFLFQVKGPGTRRRAKKLPLWAAALARRRCFTWPNSLRHRGRR